MIKTNGIIAAVFAVLTAILAYPISLRPGTTSLGSDPDVHTFTWTLAWDVHAFVNQPLGIFNANIFYPYERTLAFSENLIGSAFIAAPFIWTTGNPVLALNAVSLLSCVLCGVGAYVLARRLGLGLEAAMLCGMIFAFSPARFFRFPQTHLTTVQWIPFALAFLHTYFERGRRRDLRIALAFISLQVLTSGHGAVYVLLASAGLTLYHLARREPLEFGKRMGDIGIPGVLLLLPSALIVPPYLRVQRELGLVRTLENWAPTPVSFLASPTWVHEWLQVRLLGGSINDRASAFLFPGVLPLGLAVAAVIGLWRGRSRQHTVFYLLLAVIATLLSAGPPLGLWPYVYWIPGLNFIRVPSRFFLLAVLAVAVLAALGFEHVTRRRGDRTRRMAAAAAAVFLLLEFSRMPLPVVPYRVEVPPVDRWLASQPKPFAIAEVPVEPLMRYHSTYMLHSMAHWQRTVHGHSSLLPPLHEKLYDQLRSFPDDASIASLRDLRVTYVVVHRDWYRAGDWDVVRERLDRFAAALVLRYEDQSGRVYALQREGVP